MGADPQRVAWALDIARAARRDAGRSEQDVSFGAYVNVGCHPDPAVGCALIRGSIAAFAHFSAMPGSTGAGLDERDRAVVAEVGRRYDSNVHLMNAADHTAPLEDGFVARFGVVGSPETCAARLGELADLGLERFVITGPTLDADREEGRRAMRLMRDELLPALREGRTGA